MELQLSSLLRIQMVVFCRGGLEVFFYNIHFPYQAFSLPFWLGVQEKNEKSLKPVETALSVRVETGRFGGSRWKFNKSKFIGWFWVNQKKKMVEKPEPTVII